MNDGLSSTMPAPADAHGYPGGSAVFMVDGTTFFTLRKMSRSWLTEFQQRIEKVYTAAFYPGDFVTYSYCSRFGRVEWREARAEARTAVIDCRQATRTEE